ncbi:unnamed protein product [Phytophthora fragariaefolia]|uniref:Unnamed protein product n=1 Tax=Phytophthora fragariaefolia TaxID=1490495 RepID=A0A9W6XBR1_9STRA|nr:unnamed protein product [Phytophthora fragariaefolia]
MSANRILVATGQPTIEPSFEDPRSSWKLVITIEPCVRDISPNPSNSNFQHAASTSSQIAVVSPSVGFIFSLSTPVAGASADLPNLFSIQSSFFLLLLKTLRFPSKTHNNFEIIPEVILWFDFSRLRLDLIARRSPDTSGYFPRCASTQCDYADHADDEDAAAGYAGPAAADPGVHAPASAVLMRDVRESSTFNTQKQKVDPPKFNGKSSEDLELWLFHIEEHLSAYASERNSPDTRFVDMVVPFLGPEAMLWYREFENTLGDSPRVWAVFKQQIRLRFCDRDYDYKLLSKLHNLRVSGTQQDEVLEFDRARKAPRRGLDVPVSTHQSEDFSGVDTSCSFQTSTPTTQAAGTPAASAAANTVVVNLATTGSPPASTSVVTSTVTTPSSPKRTMSLGDYKKTRDNIVLARDELEALFDVGSDADMEDGEEEDEGTSS